MKLRIWLLAIVIIAGISYLGCATGATIINRQFEVLPRAHSMICPTEVIATEQRITMALPELNLGPQPLRYWLDKNFIALLECSHG